MCIYFFIIAMALLSSNVFLRHAEKKPEKYAAKRRLVLLHAQQWDAIQDAVKAKPELQHELDQGGFNYAEYVEVATREAKHYLLEFPPTTWLIVLGYALLFAILSGQGCQKGHDISLYAPPTYIVWAVSTGYLLLRIGFFHVHSKWVMPELDRYVLWPVGPAFLGFLPWQKQPRCVPGRGERAPHLCAHQGRHVRPRRTCGRDR